MTLHPTKSLPRTDLQQAPRLRPEREVPGNGERLGRRAAAAVLHNAARNVLRLREGGLRCGVSMGCGNHEPDFDDGRWPIPGSIHRCAVILVVSHLL